MIRGLILAALAAGCLPACGHDSSRWSREVVQTEAAPKAIGPYSQAIRTGRLVFCSGQVAIDPATGKLVGDSAEAEARQVLKNLGAVLEAANASFDDVVRATVYLSDMNDYKTVNNVYAEYFSSAKPARAAVQVAKLPLDARVEISCIAVVAD